MFVEYSGSAYLPLASRPARTVDRGPTGYHPVVEYPGRETAASSETLLDDWIRNPGMAVAVPGSAATVAAAPGAAVAPAMDAATTPVAPAAAASMVTATMVNGLRKRACEITPRPPHRYRL